MMNSLPNQLPLRSPLVSICVQTYQHEEFIGQCLESLVSQKTNFTFEIIIGEDASSDRTPEICKEYQRNYPELIRLYHRDPAKKISIGGRKTGRYNFLENLKSARGKYICLCDGDDYWIDEAKLQKQVELMESNPSVDLLYTGYIHQRADLSTFTETVPDIIHSPDELTTIHYLGHVSTWMFKNELESLVINPIIYKAFAMDMVLFAYFKNKGKIAGQSLVSSFYRFNQAGLLRSKRRREMAKDYALIHFYFYRYIHKNLKTLVKSGTGYYVKSYLKSHLKV
ncbi:glycosyltransferase family 2 protein [Algoriphagus namhaensis]